MRQVWSGPRVHTPELLRVATFQPTSYEVTPAVFAFQPTGITAPVEESPARVGAVTEAAGAVLRRATVPLTPAAGTPVTVSFTERAQV
ncbi:hypothetical protein ABT301_27055 [Streptomyces sp. NPDC000987]|uniref:hypothetical protein n=1 Tax=Streptomyces sp. NPDC000987 TaxID=3154374 RepID=UPI0033328836